MKQEETLATSHKSLIDSILEIMIKNGIGRTTMDHISSTLKISKRTLYEIFSSKDSLIAEVIEAYNTNLADKHLEIAQTSNNEIEALLKIFLYSRDIINHMDIGFYHDMDAFYMRNHKNSRETQFIYLKNMLALVENGVKNGLFREDINYLVHFRMLVLQMESLKRFEQTFPSDITLLDVYDTVCVSFVRGIASEKGMKVIDKFLSKHPELVRKIPLNQVSPRIEGQR